MANASRLLLMASAIGLLATGAVMLFKNSESTLMIVPIIGAAILMGFGYSSMDVALNTQAVAVEKILNARLLFPKEQMSHP